MYLSEINLNVDANQFEISKIEEQRAFQYYKEKLLPEDVKDFNLEIVYRGRYMHDFSVDITTPEEVTKSMRKTHHGKAQGINGTQIEYKALLSPNPNTGGVWFTLAMSREKVGYVTLRYWHTYGKIALKTDINEGLDPLPPGWGNISKIDEAAGFQVIKEKWVPEFVKHWNKYHPVHKVTEHNILKTLRKVRHDSLQMGDDFKKWPRSDIIHYQAPLPGRYQHVTFMIHRYTGSGSFRNINVDIAKHGTLMAGYFMGTTLFEKPVYAS